MSDKEEIINDVLGEPEDIICDLDAHLLSSGAKCKRDIVRNGFKFLTESKRLSESKALSVLQKKNRGQKFKSG